MLYLLYFNTKHIASFSNPRLLFLCLRSFGNKLFPLLPPAGLKSFDIYYIHFLKLFRGSLEKLFIEEHTQNETTSSLSGIHWMRLVLNHCSSDINQGKATFPFKRCILFQDQRAKILVYLNTESTQKGETLFCEGLRSLEDHPWQVRNET